MSGTGYPSVIKLFTTYRNDYGYYYDFNIKETSCSDPPHPPPFDHDHDMLFNIEISISYFLIRGVTGGGRNPPADADGRHVKLLHTTAEDKFTMAPIQASRPNLIWQLYFLFEDDAFSRVGLPSTVAKNLISDLFEYAKSMDPATAAYDHTQNGNRPLHILVSLEVCTLQAEGETIDEVSHRIIKNGTTSSKLLDTPRTKSSKLTKEMLQLWIEDDKMMMEDCPICLDGKSCKVEGIRLPCKHLFHTRCMFRWIVNNNTCPLCRSSIF